MSRIGSWLAGSPRVRDRLLRLRPAWSWMLAFLAAGCAAWAAQRYLDQQTERLRLAGRSVMVERLVAGQRLDAGVTLHPAHLALRQMPVEWMASHGLVPGDVARVTGKTLRWGLQAGEALTEMHLAEPPPVRLSERLAPGRRALTITVTQASTQSGLLQPGDRIDLFVALPRQGRRSTTSLLQDVVVLATGAEMDGDGLAGSGVARAYRTVTLDVSQDDALLLLAARQEGDMVAILRASGDSGAGQLRRSVSLDQLLGIAAAPAPAEPAVLYGNHRTLHVPPLDGLEPGEQE